MKYAHIEWNNGQPYSTEYDDVYYSAEGGVEETEYVFVQQNNLQRRWQQSRKFIIAETGFGTGLNFIVTLQHWLAATRAPARLHYFSVEKHPLSPADLRRVAATHPALQADYDELIAAYPLPMPGLHVLDFAGGRARLYLYFGDVLQMLQQISCKVDAWYLDGFAPVKNPAMWSDEVFALLARRSIAGATFSTYTSSGQVRRALAEAGFTVIKTAGFGSKRDMLKGGIFEQRCYSLDKPWFSLPETRHPGTAENAEVLIIGAGLAGLSIAWLLVQRGWRVRIIDREVQAAAGASGNPAGLVMPRLSRQHNNDASFYARALAHAVRGLDELQAACAQRFWFGSGNLLYGDTKNLRALCELHEYPDEFASMLSATQADAVAGIAIGRSALYLKQGGWARPDQLCRAIVAACGDGLQLQQGDVRDLRYLRGRWQLLDADAGPIATAPLVVLANAAACRDFGPVSGLPLAPARGQLTRVPATAASRGLKCGISFGHYVTPALYHSHVTGASFEPESDATGLDMAAQTQNLACLDELVPGLFARPVELDGRASLRAISADRVPLAGAVPDAGAFEHDYADLHHGRPDRLYPPSRHLPGLYLSSGHGSRGLVSCFVCAEVVAAMINHDPLPLEKDLLDYINPARFLVRKFRRSRP